MPLPVPGGAARKGRALHGRALHGRRHPISLLLGAALGAIAPGCGQPPLERSEPTPGAPHFTVMTYNVYFRSAGQPATLAVVGEVNADVVALQEVTPEIEAELRDRHTALYPYQLFYSTHNTDGLAVLSHYPLVDRGIQPGPGGWHPAWHVDVELPGVRLQLLNVHLRSLFSGSSSPIQSLLDTGEDHLLEIADLVGPCDVEASNLVLGDFNEGPEGGALRYLERLGFENVLPAFHPGQPTWRFRSVAGQLESTIDHILADASLRPLDAWVELEGRSDHLPVIAHFELRAR